MPTDVTPATTTPPGRAGAPAPLAPAWSAAQLVRLESEWRRLRRGFAFHPTVKITPTAGEPPSQYRIEFRLRTLIVDAAGQLAYVDTCTVELSLPPQFPHAAPVLRPGAALFHPNVSGEHVHLSPPWHAGGGSLVDVVTRCGQMLAYQFYDPVVIYNVAAMQWVTQYPHLIPTDPGATFSPDAGGAPLDRIVRGGTETLEQHKSRLAEMSLGILEGGPGTSPAEVRRFASQMSVDVGVFSDPDVPEALRTRAAELDAWAQSMTATSPTLWDDLRVSDASTRAVVNATQRARAAQEALGGAIRAVETLGEGMAGVNVSEDDPLATVNALPGVAALDGVLIRLRAAVRDVEPHMGVLRGAMEQVPGATLAPLGTPGSLLFERASAETTRAQAAAVSARQAAEDALAAVAPALARARAEQAALDALVAWAGFADLLRRGNEMTERLIDLGVAGIQAYFVDSAGETFGPYDFEDRLDLGNALLIVRRIGTGPLEVYDARTMAALGKGAGSVRVKISGAGGDGAGVSEADVRASDHIEELRLQLDYLIKTSRDHVVSLGTLTGGGQSDSWAGRMSAALVKPESAHAAAETHRRASHRWTALLADLDAVAPFKERLATSHLLERHAEFVPAVRAAAAKAQASLNEANDRLAFIAARSTRDAESGIDRLVVPPQFGQEYVDRLKQRTKAEKDLAKVRKLLSLVAAELQTRLTNKSLHGKPGLPTLRMLAMPEDAPANLAETLSDQRLRSRLQDLDRMLETRLAAHLG